MAQTPVLEIGASKNSISEVLEPLYQQKPPAPPEPKSTLLAPPKSETPKVELKKLNIAECLAIAEANHPAIRMAELSLAQTVKGADAINKLPRIAQWIKPELPVRKQQASHGIIAAEANILKAKQETTYDVCRLYYTFVYAVQQEEVIEEILAQLKIQEEFLKKLLKNPNPEFPVSAQNLSQIKIAIGLANSKKLEAQYGQKQAIVALRQAMGLDPTENDFEPFERRLPIIGGTLTQEQVVSVTMNRRPELIQAAAATDAFRLEVCAQDKNRYGLQVQTLANATDLHANVVPAAVRNGDYRPGATPPEMPPFLFGSRTDRVSRALDISRRQDYQFEQVRNLVKLQSVYAYLNWQKTAEKMAVSKLRFEAGRELINNLKVTNSVQKPAEYLQNFAAASMAQSEYLDAVYDHIKSVINLELVTAGAVRAGFPNR